MQAQCKAGSREQLNLAPGTALKKTYIHIRRPWLAGRARSETTMSSSSQLGSRYGHGSLVQLTSCGFCDTALLLGHESLVQPDLRLPPRLPSLPPASLPSFFSPGSVVGAWSSPYRHPYPSSFLCIAAEPETKVTEMFKKEFAWECCFRQFATCFACRCACTLK